MDGTFDGSGTTSEILEEQHSSGDTFAPSGSATRSNVLDSMSGDTSPKFDGKNALIGDLCTLNTKKEELKELEHSLPALGVKHEELISGSSSFDFKTPEVVVNKNVSPADTDIKDLSEPGVTVEAITNNGKETSSVHMNPDSTPSPSDSATLEVRTELGSFDNVPQYSDQNHALVGGESSKHEMHEDEGAVGGNHTFSSKPKETLLYDHDLIFTQFFRQCLKHKRDKGFIPHTNKKYLMATDCGQDIKTFCVLFAIRGTNIPKILRTSTPEYTSLIKTRIYQYNVYGGKKQSDLGNGVLTIERIASLAPQQVCSIFKFGHGDLIANLAPLEVSVPRAMQTSMFAGICPTGPPKYCYYFYHQLSAKVFKHLVPLPEIVKRVDTVFQWRKGLTLQKRQDYCVALELASYGDNGWSWNKDVLDIFETAKILWDEITTNASINVETPKEFSGIDWTSAFDEFDWTSILENLKLSLESPRQTVVRKKHWRGSDDLDSD